MAKPKEAEKKPAIDVERSYTRKAHAKGPALSNTKVFMYLLLFVGFVLLLRSYRHGESEPEVRESSVQKIIPSLTTELLLLPGAEVKVVKAFRVFQDGTKEMLEYSVSIPSRDRGSIIEFSAQGENGADGDDHIRGDRFSLDKRYSLAGANNTNRDTHYLKFQNLGTVPFIVTVSLKGKDRYTVFPDGTTAIMPWE